MGLTNIRPSRDWRWNAGLGLLAVVFGVLFLVRPDFALAVVAGTLGLNLMLLGGWLIHTAWSQRDAEVAYEQAASRVRYVQEPHSYQPPRHERAYRSPDGGAWVHVRRGWF